MFMLDKALAGLAEAGTGVAGAENTKAIFKELGELGEGYVGSTWSGVAVPMQQLTDMYDTYREYMTGEKSVVRDTSADPLAGPMKRRIPEGASNLPEVELATRAAPPVREHPWMRQVFGQTVKSERNPAEKMFSRLDFGLGDILPSSGVDAWDNAVKHEMGPLVEKLTSAYVQQPWFLNLDRDLQEGYLKEHLEPIREAARRVAAAKHPDLWEEAQIKGLPGWKKRTLKKLTRQATERQKRLEAGQ